MNKILDLRFVIGVFFAVIGLLLLGYHFGSGNDATQSTNLWCGFTFTIFGAAMILLSFWKDANDELTTGEK